MGLETAILAGLNVASAIGNYNAAKSESRAIARAGEIRAQNRADEIKKLDGTTACILSECRAGAFRYAGSGCERYVPDRN